MAIIIVGTSVFAGNDVQHNRSVDDALSLKTANPKVFTGDRVAVAPSVLHVPRLQL